MTFTTLLAVSAAICLVGLVIRLSHWFSQGIRPATAPEVATGERLAAALQGLLGSFFSAKVFCIIKSAVLDLLLQKRIFDKNSLRWIAHTLIFFGFISLFFMHALHLPFIKNYQSTLAPYLFLRNLFGLMVLFGVAIAIFRRLSLRPQRLKSSASDWTALVFLLGIVISGMLLEGAKIASRSEFQRMLDSVSLSDEEEIKPLEAFWVQENGLISPNVTLPPPAELVAQGKGIHGDYCADCHAPNKAAFASFSVAKIAPLFFAMVGDAKTVTIFWYLHIITCMAFLAWLPFSKMFHILAAPISLMTKSVTGDLIAQPANVLTRQMVGLSACTHCGTCSLECSSNMFFESFGNDFILPSEKVQYLKKVAAGKEHDPAILKRLLQGLYVCTSCDRCTTVCPSGINLKELFVSARYTLLGQGTVETTLLSHFSFPLALAQNFVDDHLQALKRVTDIFKKSFQHLGDISLPITLGKGKDLDNTTFRGCYSCQRCTNICPVVRSFDNPTEALGMLPHQIMFSLGIGNTELAMGAQMLWSCSTCYLCQEHCPNQVELCDIFYTLKNRAITRIEAGSKV